MEFRWGTTSRDDNYSKIGSVGPRYNSSLPPLTHRYSLPPISVLLYYFLLNNSLIQLKFTSTDPQLGQEGSKDELSPGLR